MTVSGTKPIWIRPRCPSFNIRSSPTSSFATAQPLPRSCNQTSLLFQRLRHRRVRPQGLPGPQGHRQRRHQRRLRRRNHPRLQGFNLNTTSRTSIGSRSASIRPFFARTISGEQSLPVRQVGGVVLWRAKGLLRHTGTAARLPLGRQTAAVTRALYKRAQTRMYLRELRRYHEHLWHVCSLPKRQC